MIESKDNISKLLEKCKNYPRTYNRAAMWLYEEYGVQSAELSLLLTAYHIDRISEEGEEE